MVEKLANVWYILNMEKHFFTGNKAPRLILALLVFGLAAFPLGAQGFLDRVSWFGTGSILFFPEDNGPHSAPMPVLPSPGAGASFRANDIFRAEFTLDLYTTHYGYPAALNRPVPVEIEHRTARVIGCILGFQLAGYFDVTPNVTVRAYGGPAADLRMILVASGLTAGLDDMDEVRREVDLVRNYFWSKGRWFLPFIGVGADYTLNSGFKVGLDFRVWVPVYRLWTGENLPTVEGWRFGPGIRLTVP